MRGGIELAREVGERPLIAQALNVKGELARVLFLGNMSFIADHRGDYEGARRLALEAMRMSWSGGRRLMARGASPSSPAPRRG